MPRRRRTGSRTRPAPPAHAVHRAARLATALEAHPGRRHRPRRRRGDGGPGAGDRRRGRRPPHRPGRPRDDRQGGGVPARRGTTPRRSVRSGSWVGDCWRSSTPPPPTPRRPDASPPRRPTPVRPRRSRWPTTARVGVTAGSPSPPCTGRSSASTSWRSPAPKRNPDVPSSTPSRHRLGQAFCEYLETRPDDTVPHSGGLAATVVVTMTHESLLGDLRAAGLCDGTRISAGEARRLACSAGIIPVVLGGASEPLDVGRQRRFHTKSPDGSRWASATAAARPSGVIGPRR